MKNLLLPNTVNQKHEKLYTARLDDTAIPHIKINITEIPLEKKLNTGNPYVPLLPKGDCKDMRSACALVHLIRVISPKM